MFMDENMFLQVGNLYFSNVSIHGGRLRRWGFPSRASAASARVRRLRGRHEVVVRGIYIVLVRACCAEGQQQDKQAHGCPLLMLLLACCASLGLPCPQLFIIYMQAALRLRLPTATHRIRLYPIVFKSTDSERCGGIIPPG